MERLGRRLLVALLALLLGVRRRRVTLPEGGRILVVRLDERVGNLVLVTPLLASLKQRFPRTRIDVLANTRASVLLAKHPHVEKILGYRKRALLASDGPFGTLWRLRRGRYDLAVDATNPLDPSTTQAIVVRFSGAHHTLGFAHRHFGRLFSARVRPPDPSDSDGIHEIDMRLRLLDALPGTGVDRRTSLGPLPTPSAAVVALLEEIDAISFGLLNVGARLQSKRLSPATCAQMASQLLKRGLLPLLVYGPGETDLAAQVARLCPEARLAPPTSLVDLANLAAKARVVLTCDTGPMHLAVAVGTPTCGIFVSTSPRRYGYTEPPHAALDAREKRSPAAWLELLAGWLESTGL